MNIQLFEILIKYFQLFVCGSILYEFSKLNIVFCHGNKYFFTSTRNIIQEETMFSPYSKI